MRDHIGAVLGRTPSGLFILSACSGTGLETGMLASWVQQSSFEPPLVTVAINRKRYINDWLATVECLALSLVGESQKKLLGHFGRGFEPHEPAFEGIDIERTPEGLPVLTQALGWLSGHVAVRVESGDHWLYIVEIRAAGRGVELETQRPWVHIRKNGFGY